MPSTIIADAGLYYTKDQVDDIIESLDVPSGVAETISSLTSSVTTVSGDVESLSGQVTANTESLSGKQDTLVSGVNIKTINSQSLLGSGNIEITTGGTFVQEQADWNEEDETALSYIQNKPTIPADMSADVQTLSGTVTAHTSNTTVHVTNEEKNTWNAKQNPITVDQTVVSGSTNPVSGGAVYSQIDGLKMRKLTQSQYAALTVKDPDTLYVVISD